MSSASSASVTRRQVFYIPGYDPFPPRRYRELYRKESLRQAQIAGYHIAMEPTEPRSGFGWRVAAEIDDRVTVSDVEVLVWSDIVRNSRPTGIWRTYLDMVQTAWIYASSGALFRLVGLRKGPILAALYPVAALSAQLFLAILLGWALARIAARMAQELGFSAAASAGAAVALGVVIACLVLRWFRDNDDRFFAYYLMHDFAFSARDYGAYPLELETRLAVFRDRIETALDSDVDEVLLVGHSSGAHLGVSVLADVAKGRAKADKTPDLAFLSLGHVVPMVSFLPEANRLRGDLRSLSETQDVTWVDVTAPGDGCCFALCDPVSVSGQATARKCGPLVFSAAFTQSLSSARWKALRFRFFRLHFQYLCAFDRPRDYDYFQITAGPLRLADRYAGRAASKSVRESPVSGYTAVAPR